MYNQLCHQPGVTASCQQLHHPHHLALHSTKYKYIYIYLIIIHKCTTAPCFIKFSKLKQKFCFMFICMLYLAETMITLLFYCVLILFLYILLKLELFGARYNLMFKPWIGGMAES